MNLHLRKNGTEYGPHTESEIRDLYNERVVSDNDIVILEDGSEITVAELLKTVRTKLVGPAKRKLEEESAPPPGSELKRFMVAKGLLVRKDQLTVGSMRSDHGGRLTLKTTILSMGNTLASKKTYGVVLSFEGDDGSTKGVDHIDFDELAEIAEAIDFMQDLAPKMSREACEYTEGPPTVEPRIRRYEPGSHRRQGQGSGFGVWGRPHDSPFLIRRPFRPAPHPSSPPPLPRNRRPGGRERDEATTCVFLSP